MAVLAFGKDQTMMVAGGADVSFKFVPPDFVKRGIDDAGFFVFDVSRLETINHREEKQIVANRGAG